MSALDLTLMRRHIVAKILARPSLSGQPVTPAPTPEGFDAGIAFWPVGAPRQQDALGGGRVQTVQAWAVVYVATGDTPAGLEGFAQELYAALDQSAGEYSGVGVVWSCLQTRPYDACYLDPKGRKRWNLGGVYEIAAKATDVL